MKTYTVLGVLAFLGVLIVSVAMVFMFRETSTHSVLAQTKTETVYTKPDKATVVDQATCLLQQNTEGWGYSKQGIISELKGFGYDSEAIEYAKAKLLNKEDYVKQAKICVKTLKSREGMTDTIVKDNLEYLGFTQKQIAEALK